MKVNWYVRTSERDGIVFRLPMCDLRWPRCQFLASCSRGCIQAGKDKRNIVHLIHHSLCTSQEHYNSARGQLASAEFQARLRFSAKDRTKTNSPPSTKLCGLLLPKTLLLLVARRAALRSDEGDTLVLAAGVASRASRTVGVADAVGAVSAGADGRAVKVANLGILFRKGTC